MERQKNKKGCFPAVLQSMILLGLIAPALFSPRALAGTDWDTVIREANSEKLKTALQAQGPGFIVDADLMCKLCGRQELVQTVLDFIYGVDGNRTAKPEPRPEPAAPQAAVPEDVSSPPVNVRPVQEPGVEKRSIAIYREVYNLLNSLRVTGDMEGSGKTTKRLIETRETLTRTIMIGRDPFDPERYQEVTGESLPDWVATLAKKAERARDTYFPVVKLEAKNVTFTIPLRENGVKGYVALFMVKKKPSGDTFKLEDELLASHEDFPLTYDPSSDSLDMKLLGKPSRNMWRLAKLLNRRDELNLFPGVWAIRIKHTTGRGQLRSDQTHYFEVKAGTGYRLVIAQGVRGDTKHLRFALEETN